MKKIKPKLVKTKNFSGYPLKDIEQFLGKKEFKKFQDWLLGETVGIYKGDSIVYKYDFERFSAGLPPLL